MLAATNHLDVSALILGIIYLLLFVCECQQIISACFSKNKLITYRNGIMMVLCTSALCRWLVWGKVLLVDAFYVDDTLMMILYFLPVWLNFCAISMLCVFYAYVLFEGFFGNYPWYITFVLNICFAVFNITIAYLLNVSTGPNTTLIYDIYISYAIFLDTFTALLLAYFGYHFYRIQHRRQRHWLFQSLPKSPETFTAMNLLIVACFLLRSVLVGLLSSGLFTPKEDSSVRFNVDPTVNDIDQEASTYHTSYTILFFYLSTEVVPNLAMLYLLYVPPTANSTGKCIDRLRLCETCAKRDDSIDDEDEEDESGLEDRDSMDFTENTDDKLAKLLFKKSKKRKLHKQKKKITIQSIMTMFSPSKTTQPSSQQRNSRKKSKFFYYFEEGQLKKQSLSPNNVNDARLSSGSYQPIAQRASHLTGRLRSSSEDEDDEEDLYDPSEHSLSIVDHLYGPLLSQDSYKPHMSEESFNSSNNSGHRQKLLVSQSFQSNSNNSFVPHTISVENTENLTGDVIERDAKLKLFNTPSPNFVPSSSLDPNSTDKPSFWTSITHYFSSSSQKQPVDSALQSSRQRREKDEEISYLDEFSHSQSMLHENELLQAMKRPSKRSFHSDPKPTRSVDEDHSIRVIYEDVYPEQTHVPVARSSRTNSSRATTVNPLGSNGASVTNKPFLVRPSSTSNLQVLNRQSNETQDSQDAAEQQLRTPHQLLQMQQREYLQHIAGLRRTASPHVPHVSQTSSGKTHPSVHQLQSDDDTVEGTRLSWSGSLRL